MASTILLTGAAHAQHFTGLGTLPDHRVATPEDVSDDGSVVVGTSIGDSSRAFRWTREGGMEDLGVVPGVEQSQAYGVSADGLVVAGHSWGLAIDHAFHWTRESGMTGLGWLYPNRMRARASGISADGRVIVGSCNDGKGDTHAVAWTNGAIRDLGTLIGGEHSWAGAASDDGSVIVGSGTIMLKIYPRRAACWGCTVPQLGTLPGHTSSYATDVSADGSVVVGESSRFEVTHAFRWTRTTGMTSLGAGTAHGVSGDGSLVVGLTAGNATVWSDALGMVNLNTYLPTLGINLDGWTLVRAKAVSRDGLTIVGDGQHHDRSEAWVATLAPRCAANCDGSTAPPVLNVDDFACFQARFVAGDARANCDGSTATPALNVLDFVCFMQRFAAGCP